jgi:hypothetical protein
MTVKASVISLTPASFPTGNCYHHHYYYYHYSYYYYYYYYSAGELTQGLVHSRKTVYH